jgi:hypothetical protein
LTGAFARDYHTNKFKINEAAYLVLGVTTHSLANEGSLVGESRHRDFATIAYVQLDARILKCSCQQHGIRHVSRQPIERGCDNRFRTVAGLDCVQHAHAFWATNHRAS